MKYFLILLVANAASITSVCFAGYLCLKDKPGWPWFLFVAVVLAQVLEVGKIK